MAGLPLCWESATIRPPARGLRLLLIPATKASDITRMVTVIGDSGKTKAQLLEELEALRSRVVEIKLDPAVTERKGAEEVLRESVQRFRLIFENAAAGIVTISLDGRFTQVNPAFCRFTGYNEAELLTLTVPEITHPGDREETVTQFDEVRVGRRQVIDLYKRYVRKDGATVWAHVTAAFLSGSDGTPSYCIALVQDITARKRAEDALRSVVEGTSEAVAEEFVPSLVRNLAAALQVRYAFVSEVHPTVPKRLRLLALWDGTGFAEPFEYDVTGTPCEKVFADKIAYYPSEVGKAFPKDRWLQDNGIESYLAVPLSDREENPIGHLGVMHDAPMQDDVPRESILRVFAARAGAELKRRRAEEALRLTQFAVEHSSESIYWVRSDGRITYANKAACRALGYSSDELISMTVPDINPDLSQDAWPAQFAKMKEAASLSLETHDRTKEGRIIPVEILSNYLDYEGKEYVCVFVRDITERKQAEDERKKLEKKARELEAELAHVSRLSTMGEMAAVLAHELNQPLAAIGNYADGSLDILQSAEADAQDVRESLEQIGRLTRRAGKIIQRIRNLVRKDESHPSSVPPNDLIREVVELVEFEAQAEAVKIELDLADELPLVLVDRIQIQQVILNLARNAFDAMRGIDQRTAKLTIQTRSAPVGSVEVTVSDTGKGLPEGAAEKCFEPFFTTKSDGLGLGLGISRSIIEAHGGRLWTEPQTEGARFRFSLPAVPVEPDGEA